MRLLGLALKNLKINLEYNLAVSVLAKEEVKEIIQTLDLDEAINDIFGDIIAFLSNLGGVKGVLLLCEESDGRVKANLRTAEPNMDISRLAQIFGGGGHPKASGFLVLGKIVKKDNGWEFDY